MSELQLPVREFNIGIRLKKQMRNWVEECASDRIRARLVAESLPETIEIYRDDTNYFNVIYHDIDTEIRALFNVLDVCDYCLVLEPRFKDFASKMDLIVCATQALADVINVDVPKVIIGDGHDLTKRLKKHHTDKAKKAVWFGYSANFTCVQPFLPFLKEHNIQLRVISEHDNRGHDEFIKWDLETADKHINECDFALLPKNGEYKTNNKDVTAWLNGLPVAKTEEDIVNFIEPFNRIENLSKIDYREYDINKIARQYFDLCVEYSASKRKELMKQQKRTQK